MPSQRKAKVVRLGDSYAIFLPRDWVRGNGIRKGSVVEIAYDEVLTVRAPMKAAGTVASDG